MREQVLSRSRRILRPLNSYQEVYNKEVNLFQHSEKLLLQADEVVIGVYQSLSEKESVIIVITELGLHLLDKNDQKFIAYEQIISIKIPNDKEHVDRLVLKLNTGQELECQVKGSEGKFRDAFEFSRFLSRVVSDIHSKQKVSAV